MEQGAALKLKVANSSSKALENAVVEISAPRLMNQRIKVPNVAANQSTLVAVPLNTALRSDHYEATVRLLNSRRQLLSQVLSLNITIVPRPLPHRMPVILWGGGEDNLQLVKEIGFTHQQVHPASDTYIRQQKATGTSLSPKQVVPVRETIDQLFAMQLVAVASLTPVRNLNENHKEFSRVDREGKPYANANVCPYFEPVQSLSFDVGASVARTFGDMPGLQAAAVVLANTRGGSGGARLCFHHHDQEAYRRASGQEIPDNVSSQYGISYRDLKEFPAHRIVADDHPVLRYYRWFWSGGDGTPLLLEQTFKGLKSTGRHDILAMGDVWARPPSIRGHRRGAEIIQLWVYTNPEPMAVALTGDDLLTMAGGTQPQSVMEQTQLIWHRAQVAPVPQPGQKAPQSGTQWEKEYPDNPFVTISPDHLSEALWFKISSPVKGLLFHGWPALVGSGHRGYKLTNRETQPRLKQLLNEVVKPLGPTLLQVPDRPTDVAFLQSFASQMLGGRVTWGGANSWSSDVYRIARHAALQPKVIFDEDIARQGLAGYKVLFLADCDVLSQSVADNIRKWQQQGGIVIGDEHLAPGIRPNILITSFNRSAKADEYKAALLAQAATLRGKLDSLYQRPVDSSNAEVILRQRQFGNTEYLFAINDKRTFGDYVGQYGLVMEKGLSTRTALTLNRSHGVVYDLLQHRVVPTRTEGNRLRFDAELEPGAGAVYIVLDKAPTRLQITAPLNVRRGQSLSCRIRLSDAVGKPINAVVPMKVTVRDSQGRESERSGHYGAVNGDLNLSLDIAPNDATGPWQVEVEEGISGIKAIQRFVVGSR
jgi:hypothetical protein